MAEVTICWWLRWLPEGVGLAPHGEPECRIARAWLSDALQLLCIYVPVGTLYMGLAAIGIAVLYYRGELLAAQRHSCASSAVAPAACCTLPSAVSTMCYPSAVSPLPPYRHGFLGCLGVVACGPAVIVPAWLLWGDEYGSVWCWSASAALIVALFEPWAVAAARRGYERAKQQGKRPLEVRQPLWHFVMTYTMTVSERVQDWRDGGPQSRFELDGRVGPFETLVSSSGIRHDRGSSGGPHAIGKEKRSCSDRTEACLDRIGRWVERWTAHVRPDRRVEPIQPV